MNPDDPIFHTWLEPELEARLVASLLGESSAFEEAELQRLMEDRPEVAVYYREMKATHGVLREATGPEPDGDQWRLPTARRAKLEALWKTDGTSGESMPTFAKRRSISWVWVTGTSVAASLVILLGVASLRLRSIEARSSAEMAVHSAARSEGELSLRREALLADAATDRRLGGSFEREPEVVEFDGFVNYDSVSSGEDRDGRRRFLALSEVESRSKAMAWDSQGEEAPQAEPETFDGVDTLAAPSWPSVKFAEQEGLQREQQVALAREDGATLTDDFALAAGVQGAVAEGVTELSSDLNLNASTLDFQMEGELSQEAAAVVNEWAALGDGVDFEQPGAVAQGPSGGMAGGGLGGAGAEVEAEVASANAYAYFEPNDGEGFGMVTGINLIGSDGSQGLVESAPVEAASLGLERAKEQGAMTGGGGLASEEWFVERYEKPTSEAADVDRTLAREPVTMEGEDRLFRDFGGNAVLGEATAGASVGDRSSAERNGAAERWGFQSSSQAQGQSQQAGASRFGRSSRESAGSSLHKKGLEPAPQSLADETVEAWAKGVELVDGRQAGQWAEEEEAKALKSESQSENAFSEPFGNGAGLPQASELRDLEEPVAEESEAVGTERQQQRLFAGGGVDKRLGEALTARGVVPDQTRGGRIALYEGDEDGDTVVNAREVAEVAEAMTVSRNGAIARSALRRKVAKPEAGGEVEGVEKLRQTKLGLIKPLEEPLKDIENESLQEREDRTRGEQAVPAPPSAASPATLLPSAAPSLREAHATETPFSTFSLHVSDVAFKLAKAAVLDRNEWPETAKVRVEEFVNAFDYGDPAPAQREKVACRSEQAPHPFRQQRNLLRIALRTGEMGRAAGVPLHLTLLLDTSGSMEREDREDAVQRAMEVLTTQLTPSDTVTLIGFARQPRLVGDRLTGDALRQLPRLVRQIPSEGGTNLEEALLLAMEHARRQFVPQGQNRVVLLTDGAANLGDADAESLRRLVVELRQEGIAFDACGVGAKGLNDEILEALTREGDGRYYFLDGPEDADAGFARQLAGAFRPAARNVKVQVRFNERRVGHYRLLGFEKHRLKREDFRKDQVDAAELAAAEAGVALYEVEPLPQGDGEIGEVFVRFQDTASGRMVERSWTIPYQVSLSPWEAASPSMQLASTAAFLAEKLKRSPFASSIEWARVSEVATNLRQHFGASRRVNDLIAMIGRVREW